MQRLLVFLKTENIWFQPLYTKLTTSYPCSNMHTHPALILSHHYRANWTTLARSGSELHMTSSTWQRMGVSHLKTSLKFMTPVNTPRSNKARRRPIKSSRSSWLSGTLKRPTESSPSTSSANITRVSAVQSTVTTTLRSWWRTRGSFENISSNEFYKRTMNLSVLWIDKNTVS